MPSFCSNCTIPLYREAISRTEKAPIPNPSRLEESGVSPSKVTGVKHGLSTRMRSVDLPRCFIHSLIVCGAFADSLLQASTAFSRRFPRSTVMSVADMGQASG